MITRLYIHNYKALVNFEIEPGELALLMGPNGAGKSSVLEILDALNRLVGEGVRLDEAFTPRNRSRLSGSSSADPLIVELELAGNGGDYRYRLEVEYSDTEKKQRIALEELHFNDKPLFRTRLGDAQLYRDDHSKGPHFPMDWSQSGVGFLMESKDNARLTWFRRRIGRIHVVRINPFLMREESRQEATAPASDLHDFADWYRYLVQSRFDAVQEAVQDLQERIPGFLSLTATEMGDARLLKARFDDKQSFPLSSLSDGQRVLIALYTLLYGVEDPDGATLCIDEPENFLALPEIQPWMDTLQDRVSEGGLQAVLISHHPRVVNFLAAGHGHWLEREGTGPTRLRRIGPSESGAALTMDVLMERGWIYYNGGKKQ